MSLSNDQIRRIEDTFLRKAMGLSINDLSRLCRRILTDFSFGKDRDPVFEIDWDVVRSSNEMFLHVLYWGSGGVPCVYVESLSGKSSVVIEAPSSANVQFCRDHLLTDSMADRLLKMVLENE